MNVEAEYHFLGQNSYVTIYKLQTLLEFFTRQIKEGEKGEHRKEFGEFLKIPGISENLFPNRRMDVSSRSNLGAHFQVFDLQGWYSLTTTL